MAAPRDLRLFVAVYEERSFTAAAEREHATQSGASQHVKTLEDRLGVKLFERARGDVRPTPAGDAFYASAIEVLRAFEAANRTARAFVGGLEGEVRLGLMPTLSPRVLTPVLSTFMARHPTATVSVVEGYSGRLTELVRACELDLAIVPADIAQPGVKATPFMTAPEILLSGADSPYADREVVDLRKVQPVKLVMPSGRNIRRPTLERYCSTHGVEGRRILEIDGIMGTLDFVSRTDWATVLPSLIVGAAERNPRLKAHPLLPALALDIVVIEPSRNGLTDLSQALLTELHAVAQAEAAGWTASLPAD